jgi:hypothetical protein
VTFDIERSFGGLVPIQAEDRFPAPPALSRAGQIDRRNENEHAATMRQLRRRAEADVARTAGRLFADVAEIEAAARVASETKFKLHDAHYRSRVLAGEDPVLQAQFAVIDDTLAQRLRSKLTGY